MGLGREKALKRLRGLGGQVAEHLERIAKSPNDPAVQHWKIEAANSLNQMEAVLDQVGKKTAADWAQLITGWREQLEDKP